MAKISFFIIQARKTLFFLIVLISFFNVIAQNSLQTAFRIDSIVVSGNKQTEEFIIKRELSFNIGDSVNNQLLEFNKDRIFSLGIFNSVELNVVQSASKNILFIDVKESWYIFPVPFIETKGQSSENLSYGIYLLCKNFRGRNETFYFKGALGYDPFIRLIYSMPYFLAARDLGVNFGFMFQKASNKSINAKNLYGEQFYYKIGTCFVGLVKRVKKYNYFSASFQFSSIESPKHFEKINVSNSNIDNFLSAGFEYTYDSRDLVQKPTSGYYIQAGVTHNGFGINDINFNSLTFDFRSFKRIGNKFINKFRVDGRHTFGNTPFYNQSYFGYNEYVRGHRKNYAEGNNYLRSSIELQYPILEDWNFSVNLPILPQRLTTAKIGILLYSFCETGTILNNNSRLFDSKFFTGYGLGTEILFLPFNSIRFEYAFNEKGIGEFIIAAGISF